MIKSKVLILAIFLFTNLNAEIPDYVREKIHTHVSINTWPDLYYDVLPQIIRENDFQTVLEVGVGLGGHAEEILAKTQVKTYFGIDPYIYCAHDQFSIDVSDYSENCQMSHDYLYSWVKDERLARYKGRYRIIRKPSLVACQFFANSSLDCIFIDGDHSSFEAYFEDIKSWYPKLKDGGIILGNDFFRPVVAKAVQTFARNHHATLSFHHSSKDYIIWSIRKTVE